MLKIIKKLLFQMVDDIDAGNSHISEEEAIKLIDVLKNVSDPYISKYQACEQLGISRATFDNLVKDGKLPRGIKRKGFKELAWKKQDIIKYITSKNGL